MEIDTQINPTRSNMKNPIQINMKKLLSILSLITLLTTTGCLYSDGRGRGYAHEHGHFEGHADFEGPPAVVVRAPEVVVRPPEVIVR